MLRIDFRKTKFTKMIQLIINNYDTLIRLFLVAWFVSENEYIEAFLDKIVSKWENVLTCAFYDIITCLYCLSFWSGLVYFSIQNTFVNALFLSLSLSFIGWLVKKIAK